MKRLMKFYSASLLAAFAAMTTINASAESLSESKIVTGTTELIKDATTVLLAISAVATVLLVIYFLIRIQMASEISDESQYKKKAKTTLILGGLIFAASGIVNVIIGYYS